MTSPPKRFMTVEELSHWVLFILSTIRKKTSRHEIPFSIKRRRCIYDGERILAWRGETSVNPANDC